MRAPMPAPKFQQMFERFEFEEFLRRGRQDLVRQQMTAGWIVVNGRVSLQPSVRHLHIVAPVAHQQFKRRIFGFMQQEDVYRLVEFETG